MTHTRRIRKPEHRAAIYNTLRRYNQRNIAIHPSFDEVREHYSGSPSSTGLAPVYRKRNRRPLS